LNDWLALGLEVFQPYDLALLATAYGKTKQPEEGLRELTKALAIVNTTDERWYEAELPRLKGELILQSQAQRLKSHIMERRTGTVRRATRTAPDPLSEAESCFHQALAVARRQWAKSLELRAAMSLARLWQHQGRCAAARRHIGFVAGAAVGVILIACVFVGQALLQAFGIDIPSFRIAGGLLVLFTALAMMHTPERGTQATLADGPGSTANDSVAVVRLAIPVLAGPGAISTVIVYAHRSVSLNHYLLICAVIVAVAASTFVVLRLALVVGPLIGPTGLRVLTQIMGLLIAAIAVEFITQGLAAIFPAWQSMSTR
jgi:multiple antibiotic resistance protein